MEPASHSKAQSSEVPAPLALPDGELPELGDRADLEARLGEDALALLQRHGMVRHLVKALLAEQALADVVLTEQEREQYLATQRQRLGINGASEMARVASINGISEAQLQWQLLLPLRKTRHCHEAFGHLAETTFLRQKGNFDQVVYSLIRVRDPHLAQELYHQLQAGESTFADLALQYAEGHERLSRGVVGPKPLTSAHPALAERLRTAQPGVVQAPIQVTDVWLITRLEEMIPATFNKTTAQRICEQLFDSWLDQKATEFLAGGTQSA